MMRKKQRLIAVLFLTCLMILPAFSAGCQPDTTQPNATAPASTTTPELALKVGVMPAVDAAPILIAAQKGFFSELGLSVEVQIYTNAMNRQSALQSGGLDGA